MRAFKKLSIYKTLQEYLAFFGMVGMRRGTFAAAILCGTLVAFANLMVIRLLIPFIKGLLMHDYSSLDEFIGQSPISDMVLSTFASFNARLLLLIGCLLVLTFIKAGLSFLSEFLAASEGLRLQKNLSIRIYNRFLHFDKRYADAHGFGQMNDKLQHDSQIVTEQFTSILILIRNSLTLVGFGALLFYVSWQSSLVVLGTFGLLNSLTISIFRSMKRYNQKLDRQKVRINREIYSHLLCLPLTKSLGQEENDEKWFAKSIETMRKLSRSREIRVRAVPAIREVFGVITLMVVAYYLSAVNSKQDLAQNMSTFFVYLIVIKISLPIYQSIGGALTRLSKVNHALAELKHLLKGLDEFVIEGGHRTIDSLKQGIVFRNFEFRYNENENTRYVYKNLNLEIECGKVTAVVGPSGCGKSTLVNCLLRQYPVPDGKVFIDGADINDYDVRAVKKLFSVVTQDPFLFDTSLRQNLLFGVERDVDPDELESVLRMSGLSEFVSKLPNGLETEVGDRGCQLSGGERQRISIARALLRNAPILILDEPTSALDAGNTELVKKALFNFSRNRTVILITHTLAAVTYSDKIAVIGEQCVSEEGKFADLIQANGFFASAWNLQNRESF